MDTEKEINEMWSDIENNCLKLKILMGCKTGVGKSSVINAIIGKEISRISPDGKPCTKVNEELIWSTDTADISIIDVPGFGEANSQLLEGLSYKENVIKLAKDASMFILVLKCDDKALELEENFLIEWKYDEILSKIPLFIVINQIDKMKPSKLWDPAVLNLDNPISQKDLNIVSYIEYVSSIPTFSEYKYSKRIFPISAGEYTGDITYGIEKLRQGLNDALPEVLQMVLSREQATKDEKANNIINYYSISCGAIAVEPIPIVDSFFIAPIQVAMIIHLGKIYGVKVTKSVAGGLVQALGLSLLGNYLFLNIVSFFPGIKQVVGPAIAYSLTYTSGLIVKELFLTGNLNPTKEQLKRLAEKYKEETKAAKERYKNIAKAA